MSPPLDLEKTLTAQRWFGGKGRKIADIRCRLTLPLTKHGQWQILEVRYEDRASEWYQMPLLEEADAFTDATFRSELFDLLGKNRVIKTDSLTLRVETFSKPPPALNSSLLKIEQSNSSISYGGQSFLKIFRKLESGLNPDIEILSHLARSPGDVRVPKIYSTLYLDHDGTSYALAVLLEMVENRGNAWEIALEAARNKRDFQNEAALLGRRTAEMHLANAAETENPAFGIVDSTPSDWETTSNHLRDDSRDLLDMLAAKLPNLTGESAALAAEFLSQTPGQLSQLRDVTTSFPQIRIHGDYHLGQVLVTHDDFVIIDFEGEPARSLAERRKHRSPLIDVAGMVRSFHYAGCMAGAFEWQKTASAAFLDAYFSIARGTPVLPDEATTQTLLEVFAWQKKLYEIRYELNNRPDWLWIPLK